MTYGAPRPRGRAGAVTAIAIVVALLLAGGGWVAWRLAGDAGTAQGVGRLLPPAQGGADRSASSGAGAAAGTSTTAATPGASPSVNCGVWGCPQQQRFAAAAALLRRQPGYLGVMVHDRQTGATWTSGAYTRRIWAGSTPKLALATDLLERARSGAITLDATARSQIAAMLAVSDNDAADALWDRYSGVTQMSRFQRTYGMSSTSFVSGFPQRWGFIKTTAADLNSLMRYILGTMNPADRDYLVNAMRNVGAIQRWGVWAAGPALSPGVKDGWSIESDGGVKHWITATVGFAGPGERYTVSAMYHLLPGSGTIYQGAHGLSDIIATVFGAKVPAPITVPDPSTGY